jgi:S-adenosylmethionine/arginine decarboxylase-like enzyme
MQMTDRTNYCTGCKERQDRIEAQAKLIAKLEADNANLFSQVKIADAQWDEKCDRIEAQAAEIDIAQKVILEQLQARKEQADEIERLRQILVDAVEIINDQMPGEFPDWEIYAKSALGEAE